MIAVIVAVVIVVVVLFGLGLITQKRRRTRIERAPSPPSPTAETTGTEVTSPPPSAPSLPVEEATREESPDGHVEMAQGVVEVDEVDEEVASVAPARIGERLGRARSLFAAPLEAIRRRGRVDESVFSELEEVLILADVGLPTTRRLLDSLREAVRTGAVEPATEALIAALRAAVVSLFEGDDLTLHLGDHNPAVWLFVGVNGVGKTTTIGKLAARERALGKDVVLAAGDTFRAAAVDQLALWATRTGAEIVRGDEGADPSSVVFDAIAHAAARDADLVMADSAGRLHTKVNLMEELAKVRRVADRPPGGVTETLLVLDATTGQNGLVQAREFLDTAQVTGVVLTKLDGTAKGGIVCAIRAELGLPIKLVGLGEGAKDLIAFDPAEFAEALLA